MQISSDELEDWAQRASNLDYLVKTLGDALLDEKVSFAGYLADSAQPEAHLLSRSIARAAGIDIPEPQTGRELNWVGTGNWIEKKPEAIRAAEALERAAVLVLAVEKEYGIYPGMGGTLADFAAEMNLMVFGRNNDAGEQ